MPLPQFPGENTVRVSSVLNATFISSFMYLITTLFGVTQSSSGVYILATIVVLSSKYVACEGVVIFNLKLKNS
jgi:hypothetical protein